MIVVMAEVGNTPTLPHAKSPEHSLMTPEHIENPISWCEIVIASQDIHYASHEMTISHHERRFTMYIDGMGQDNKRYKKPMASSEGSALVALTASAGGEAPPLTLPKGGSSYLVCLRRLDKTPSPRGNTGMPPAATPTSMHTNIIPSMTKPS